jgi:hypothetical protein
MLKRKQALVIFLMACFALALCASFFSVAPGGHWSDARRFRRIEI